MQTRLRNADGRKLVVVAGTPLFVHEAAEIDIELQEKSFLTPVLVVDVLTRNIDVILG